MFELGVLGPLSPFSAGGVQVWWNKGTNVNLWNVPSLGLVCFSTALCCAEEVLLIYYYYEMSQRAVTPLALNQRLPFSRAGLRSCWARVESSLFQGSGSQFIVGVKLPGAARAVQWANRRLFPAARRDRRCQLRELFLLCQQPHLAPGNASAGPPEWVGDSGTTCKGFLRVTMNFPKLLVSTGNELVVPLCFCAARKEPGSSLAGAAAD